MLTPVRPSASRVHLGDGSLGEPILKNNREWRDKIHDYLLDRI